MPGCGKSTLTARLSAHFGAPRASEYARSYLAADPSRWIGPDGVNGFDEEALQTILKGQRASVEAMAHRCENIGLLFSDTEAIITACWARVLLGRVPDYVDGFIRDQRFDLCLVTAAIESWEVEGQRVQPLFAERRQFEEDCIRLLRARHYPCVVLRGTGDERFAQAVAGITSVLSSARDRGH